MKRNILISYCLLVIFLAGCDNLTNDPEPLKNSGNIPVISFFLKDEDYADLIANKFTDVSIPANINYKGITIKASISPQGAGSKYHNKWNYKIECQNGYTIENLSKVNLSGQSSDNLMIKNALASLVYKQIGMNVANSNLVFLKINGKNEGIYYIIERVDETFFSRRSIDVYELLKAVFGARFSWEEENNGREYFQKKIPEDDNYTNLMIMIQAVQNTNSGNVFSNLDKYLDVKKYIVYHACTSIISNSDGLSNNMYFYKKSQDSPYNIIPWDFDRSFDYEFPVDPVGSNDIIIKLFESDTCKALYRKAYFNILNTIFTEENLFPVIDSLYLQLKDLYLYDPYLVYSEKEIKDRIDAFKVFITQRRNYLLSYYPN
jgi:spore coat protein H